MQPLIAILIWTTGPLEIGCRRVEKTRCSRCYWASFLKGLLKYGYVAVLLCSCRLKRRSFPLLSLFGGALKLSPRLTIYRRLCWPLSSFLQFDRSLQFASKSDGQQKCSENIFCSCWGLGKVLSYYTHAMHQTIHSGLFYLLRPCVCYRVKILSEAFSCKIQRG